MRWLSMNEARLVAKYLEQQGISLDQGFLDVYHLTPAQVAEKYGIEESKVIEAARREKKESI